MNHRQPAMRQPSARAAVAIGIAGGVLIAAVLVTLAVRLWPAASAEADASGDVSVIRGVEVKVLSATVEKPELQDLFGRETRRSDCPALVVRISISNNTGGRKLSYASWGAGGLMSNLARLRDSRGSKYYVRHAIGDQVKGRLFAESIYPGKTVAEVIAFEVPATRDADLHLELPTAAFDDTQGDAFRFRIPAGMVRWED